MTAPIAPSRPSAAAFGASRTAPESRPAAPAATAFTRDENDNAVKADGGLMQRLRSIFSSRSERNSSQVENNLKVMTNYLRGNASTKPIAFSLFGKPASLTKIIPGAHPEYVLQGKFSWKLDEPVGFIKFSDDDGVLTARAGFGGPEMTKAQQEEMTNAAVSVFTQAVLNNGRYVNR